MFAGFSIQRGITAILIGQAALAGILLLGELEARHMPTRVPTPAAAPAPVVTPGDQRRTYEAALPRTVLRDAPSPIPLPDEESERLVFVDTEHPDLGPILLVSGTIEEGDARRLRARLDGFPTAPPPIALHSGGGLVFEAIEIGQMLRARNATTLILPGAVCLSSCPYILAGGVDRRVSRRGAVGLHQHFFDTPKFMPVILAIEDIQKGQGTTMRHLIEMGVDAAIMQHSLSTPPDDIYILVEAELTESRLATEITE